MSTQVTLSLPDKVYDQATRLAELMDTDVPHVLAETIESALSPLGVSVSGFTPVGELSDNEVLGAADLRMDEVQGCRLGRLLDRQQSGKLNETERSELLALVQVYQECLVRKAQGLLEAIRRGLREPLRS